MMTGILGGRVKVAFDNVSRIVKRVKSREVRALAVMDTERSKFLPHVPTTVELGYPSVISSSTRGIAGPKGLPEPVVKKLQDVFRKAMEHPDHVQAMETAGLAIKVMVGDEYEKYYRDLHAKTAKYTEWARSRPGRRRVSHHAVSPSAVLERWWIARDLPKIHDQERPLAERLISELSAPAVAPGRDAYGEAEATALAKATPTKGAAQEPAPVNGPARSRRAS
jgi:hypothetical protein